MIELIEERGYHKEGGTLNSDGGIDDKVFVNPLSNYKT